MIPLIALLILAADPVEPKQPVAPVVPEVKAPAGSETKSAPPAAVEAKKDAPAPEPEVRKGEEKAKVEEAPTPPSLGKKALCGELTKSGRELAAARKRLDDDRKAFETEKQTLEKLKAEIADTRIQLRAETARLEKLLAKRAEAGASEGGEKAAAPVVEAKPKPPATRPPELDALAKTMKSMKPEAAAALLQRTDQTLAAGVLKRMKPAEAGAVLDKLKPDFAADLMALMATMPSTPTKGGKP